jgi:SprT protein
MYSFIEDIIFTCHATLQVKLKKELKYPINIEFNSRFRATMGRWTYLFKEQRHIIQINTNAFKEESRVLKETVIHEFCHAAAYELYGDNGHGDKWAYLMQVMGLSPDRIISASKCQEIEYKVKRNNVQRYTYTCKCRSHELTLGKHKKVQGGSVFFRCVRCKETIKYYAH